MASGGPNLTGVSESERFNTTHWSVILASRDQASSSALEQLCATYWYPLYVYVRRQGHSAEDAQDLTQAFFERFLSKDYLVAVDRQKGKFRSFLLAAMNHFLSDARDRDRRKKRGGGNPLVQLDQKTAEERYRLEPVDELTAERIYERRWALTILDQVLNRLEAEFAAEGKSRQFPEMKLFLVGNRRGGSYGEIARRLGIREGSLRVAVHRMRKRYGEIFREEIAQTVASPAELKEEINYLLRVLGG